jgi:NOL1/NOP2/fmu family ribosome biogenesis protein
VAQAKLRKSAKVSKNNLSAEQHKLWKQFAEENLNVQLAENFQLFADNLYILPTGLPDLSKLKIARNGLHLGVFKKNRFEPSYALGMALRRTETLHQVELDESQFRAYIGGNPVKVDGLHKNGWYHVLVNGNGLGFAKLVNNTLKNFYPKGLRRYD